MPRFVKSFLTGRFLAALTALMLLAACATTSPKPAPPPSTAPRGSVTTLQSEVTLSLKAGGKSLGGRGYLVFRQPDRFHLVMLSPFGTTMMEVYVAGDRLTCVVPSRQAAYQGGIADLPDRNALRTWGLVRWVVETPPGGAAEPGTRERLTADGRKEILTFDGSGLLTGKTDADGNRVAYGDYRDLNGVSFPNTIVMTNAAGDTVKMVFQDPEINAPLEDAVLTPNTEGMDVLPLTEFKGI